jgi:farnesyl-diphosphate farnesyltransferase
VAQAAKLLDDLLLKTSRTFALSIPRLPEPTRREVAIAYLLFRIADTLEDATLARDWTGDPPLSHDGYLELLAELPAVLDAFAELPPESREPVRRHTLRTIDRMAGFVERSHGSGVLQLEDVSELQDYCYAVAGIVGEMLTELFLLRRERLLEVAPLLRRHAATFGEALQLVNILRDSSSDEGEGRRYLPDAVDSESLFTLARSDLTAARDYVLALQQAGAERGLVEFTALPVLLARATLDRVESSGPGTKLTRPEVQQIVFDLSRALDEELPAIPPASLPG